MANKFTLDHLSDTDFEEYCYDLVSLMGFKNVDWRKGTGLNASPADKGRDIVSEWPRVDVDKQVHSEKWFIQCKQYKRGVPAEKLQGAIAWAESERPDVLLFAVSNFLSNPAKEYLETYKQNNRPTFRIKVWERPDLENHSQGRTFLLSKYGLSDKLEFLNLMHPAHLEYIKSTHMNRIDQLLQLLDTLSDDEKMRCTGLLWELLIRPRYKEPVTGNETMGELRIDPVDYNLFKKKCLQISRDVLPDYVLTDFLVNHILQETFSHGDTTSIERYKSRMQRIMDSFEEGDESPEHIKDAKKRVQGFIDSAEDSYTESHRAYTAFCDKVVANLLLMPGGSID